MPTIMGSHCVVIVNLKTPGHFYNTKEMGKPIVIGDSLVIGSLHVFYI